MSAGAPIVLVHGAWHGAWCWEKVVPLLRARQRTVVALDLPSHGADRTPPADVTLDAYVDAVLGALEAHAEPAVLVGHSMGGMVISQAAERRPDRVATLVYVCAFLLRDGEALFEVGSADLDSRLVPNFRVDEAAGLVHVTPEAVIDIFYHDCTPEEGAAARQRLVPQPMLPLVTPVSLSHARFGRVPRVYVECRRDRAVGLAAQRRMYAAQPCATVHTLDTGHSPFYAAPQALADILTATG